MLVRLLTLVYLLLYIPLVSSAQTGFNIVFIVDQSGSMSGAINPATDIKFANDPHGRRIDAVKAMMLRLADKVDGTALIYRVSVVEFGGDVYKKKWGERAVDIVISNCELSYVPGQPGSARRRVDQCIKESGFHARWMNNTNTPKAMDVALAEFDKLERSGRANGEQQARKMLLITDGRPDVASHSIAELRYEIIKKDPRLDEWAIDFWVIGLNDASAYWNTTVDGQTDEQFWSARTGSYEDETGHSWSKASEAQGPSEIDKRIRTIVDHWLEEAKVKLPCGETPTEFVDIRPYYKSIIFEAAFSAPGAILEVVHDGAVVATLESNRNRAVTASTRLDNPKPKSYTFKVKPADRFYCVSFTAARPSVALLPLDAGIAHKNEIAKLSFHIKMAAGQHLKRLSGWPLEGVNAVVKPDVTITSPSGVSSSVEANYQGQGIYTIEWTPIEEGEYRFGFQGEVRVKTDKGWKSDPFIESGSAKNAGSLVVDPARTVLWLHLEEPQAENGLSVALLPFISDSIPISLSLHEGSRPVKLEEYVKGDLDDWLQLDIVERASGKAMPTVKRMPMKLKGRVLEALIPLDQLSFQPWKGGLWLYPGELNIRVIGRDNRVSDRYLLAGIELPGALISRRVGGDAMSVAGIEVKYSSWVVALAGILLLAVLLLLSWWIIKVLIPRLNIQSEDNKRGGSVKLLIYDGLNDVDATAPVNNFDITGQSKMVLDGQVILTTEGESKTAELFRVRRIPNLASPYVVINYRWRDDDRNRRLILKGGAPKRLWGDFCAGIKK